MGFKTLDQIRNKAAGGNGNQISRVTNLPAAVLVLQNHMNDYLIEHSLY